MALGVATLAGAGEQAEAPAVRGLPFSRIYSLEDIGYVPRGSRLDFDPFGRVAVIHDGVYAVLNDTTWANIVDTDESSRTPMLSVVPAADGRTYYAGRASWGLAEFGVDGKLHAKSLVPPNSPAWTRTVTFDDVVATADGVYFSSRNGIVFRSFAQQECQLFELAKVARIFAIGNRVFISSFDQPLRYLDVTTRSVQSLPGTILDERVVMRAAAMDATHTLLTFLDGPPFLFDGTSVVPWAGEATGDLTGRISALERLADGNIAVAITGKGVFVLSPAGKLLSSLTIPQYHRVSSIASRERGVLWLLTEDSIEKVLYQGGLTSFGQRLGLPLNWPKVARWNGRFFVASGVVLYEAISQRPDATTHFEPVKVQPPGGIWELTAWGRHLLVGNRTDIYSREADGSWKLITRMADLRHLEMVGENLCYAIGPSEIALLEWDGERWGEPTPRIPGLRNPALVHRAAQSVWVEMAGDGVARISRRDGRLQTMVVPNDPWTKQLWVNIGVVDETVVLSPLRERRRFFDEKTESWVEKPELQKLLDRSPQWLSRVWSDETGTLWAAHNEGLVKFTPKNGDYEMDLTSFDRINDRFPTVQVLPGNDIWVSAGRSLHHVEPAADLRTSSVSEPVLVSLTETTRNTALLPKRFADSTALRLPYSQNSLTFQFFSGSYAWRRAPVYQFRLRVEDVWSTLDTGSLLRFPALHEGKYHLQVRVAGQRPEPGAPMAFDFEILPPWQRTWPAYVFYAAFFVAAVVGITRWSSHLARRRNRALEKVVQQRTGELELTMKKLNEETRISATLAERDRLAGEIHDSIQQGLSGAILQLDTTLRLSTLTGELRSRLKVVRNMISYARQEVQHAVWDMHSPLLEGNDLGAALRKLTTFTATSSLVPTVTVLGSPLPLPRATTHHLLRIAQEATTNAVRHALADHISIELNYQADGVSLTIADDGVGFDPDDALNKPGHFGLRGLRARVKKLEGELTLRSSLGEGTSIHVEVPLDPAKPIARHAEAYHTH